MVDVLIFFLKKKNPRPNRSSRFARLQGIKCTLAGRNLYMRFTCSTGDAMGMNMVSKGVQNVLDFLQTDYPDMEIMSISGSFPLFSINHACVSFSPFVLFKI